TASVVLLRVPLSFPAGLPLFPGSKGMSGVASVLHFQLWTHPCPVPLDRTEFFLTERRENIKGRPPAAWESEFVEAARHLAITVFKPRLSTAREMWAECESKYGRGLTYRDEVATALTEF